MFPPQAGEPSIEIADAGVRRVLADGRVEEVAWSELDEARVVTTGDGPIAEDVLLALGAGGHGVVLPQSFTDEALPAAGCRRSPASTTTPDPSASSARGRAVRLLAARG